MDRYTYRDEDGKAYPRLDVIPKSPGYMGNIVERLADYEDAVGAGLLVRLPCSVGDTVYYIGNGDYTEKVVFATKVEERLYPIAFRTYNFPFDRGDIGKTVFLSRAEAEAALRKEAE